MKIEEWRQKRNKTKENFADPETIDVMDDILEDWENDRKEIIKYMERKMKEMEGYTHICN